ncbi:unnamed protein product [Absidia cylindrospora]
MTEQKSFDSTTDDELTTQADMEYPVTVTSAKDAQVKSISILSQEDHEENLSLKKQVPWMMVVGAAGWWF